MFGLSFAEEGDLKKGIWFIRYRSKKKEITMKIITKKIKFPNNFFVFCFLDKAIILFTVLLNLVIKIIKIIKEEIRRLKLRKIDTGSLKLFEVNKKMLMKIIP